MADRDDLLLRDAFAELTAHAAPHVRPAGVAAARSTVRRRRRTRVVALSILAALLLILPAAAWANQGGHPPVRPGVTPSTNPTTAPPTTSPPSEPPPTSDVSAPDGRISPAELARASIDVPAWTLSPDCRHGTLRFPYEGATDARIIGSTHSNLDGDDAVETAALIGCRSGEVEYGMVLALDRDRGGRIVTKGVIVQSAEGMAGVLAVEPAPAGDGVRAKVADILPCCGTPRELKQTQWRTYGWVGDRYAQTAGPTRFPPSPYEIDLSVTAAPVTLSLDANRRWIGTLKLTIRNRGPFDAAKVQVTWELPVGMIIHTSTPDGCRVDISCNLGRLPAGASTTLEVVLRYEGQPPTVTGRARVGYPSANGYSEYPDLKREDNTATIQFIVS